jgi:hypothetical protein
MAQKNRSVGQVVSGITALIAFYAIVLIGMGWVAGAAWRLLKIGFDFWN